MRTIQLNFLAASILLSPAITMVAIGQEVATVSLASMRSEVTVDEKSSEDQLEDFLTTSANTAATNIADCTLALKKCSTNTIKVFSMEVMKEQQALMKKIKALALKNEIIIPFDSFVKRNNNLSELSANAKFDAIFMQKITSTLETNVATFRAASECDDRWVRLFIADSLPILESQLAKARALTEAVK